MMDCALPGESVPALGWPEDHQFIVEWRGYALHFHTNVCGYCYSVVSIEEATRFPTEEAARDKAIRHGLQWNQYCTIKKVEPCSS